MSDTLGDGEVFWGVPQYEGTAPCPRAGHSANLVARRVFIFGGDHITCLDASSQRVCQVPASREAVAKPPPPSTTCTS